MTTTQTTTKRTLVLITAIMAILTAASFSITAKPAHAATTFTVNNTTDPGNGICDTSGCSLREAITAANSTPNSGGPDLIHFAVPGTGVKTIKPATELPAITEAVTIDGYTQTGASPNTLSKGTNANLMIELDGSGAGFTDDGLSIPASNVVIRGLVINRFGHDGINTESASVTTNIRIEGNFIGTDPSGTLDLGNQTGMRIEDTSNTKVGGTSPEARNLVSGNDFKGVRVVLSSGVQVNGNLIGTKADGVKPLPNSGDGVEIFDADNTLVGGRVLGSGNTIAFNGGNGVRIIGAASSANNAVILNSVFSNGSLGIDLSSDGKTPNDPDDADVGPNDLQNFPLITSAKTTRKGTTIKGILDSTPSTTFDIDFYANPRGTDEGKTFAGGRTVTTDADGDASFFYKLPKKVRGGTMTATATNWSNNTSEFSAPRKVRRV